MSAKDKMRARRMQRGVDSTRALIVEAAAAMFALRGYHGTKIEDIAAACGYSPAAIYKYFPSKKDLFSFLWNTMAKKLEAIYEKAAQLKMPFVYLLDSLVTSISDLLKTDPDILVAFISQRPYGARRTESELERLAAGHYREYLQRISSLMKRGIDEGALRPGDPMEYTMLLVGLLYEFAFKWLDMDKRFDIAENKDKLIDLFLNGAGNRQPREKP